MSFPFLIGRQLHLHLTYFQRKFSNLTLKAKIFHLQVVRRLLQLTYLRPRNRNVWILLAKCLGERF